MEWVSTFDSNCFFKLFLVQIKMITLVRQITKAIYLKLGVPESEGDS